MFLGSVLVGIMAQIVGYLFIGYASKVRPMVVWYDISLHWAVVPVSAVAVAGLLCWILPGRKNTRTNRCTQ